jgi:hypothetical protein
MRPRFGRSCLTCGTSTPRRSRPPPQPQRRQKKRRFRFQCLFNAVCRAQILQPFFSYFVTQMPTPPLLPLRLTSSDLQLPHVPAPAPISTCNFPNSTPPPPPPSGTDTKSQRGGPHRLTTPRLSSSRPSTPKAVSSVAVAAAAGGSPPHHNTCSRPLIHNSSQRARPLGRRQVVSFTAPPNPVF